MKNKINLIFFTLFFLKNDLKSSNNNNGIRKSSSLGSLNGRCNISIEQIQPKNPFNNQLSQESNYNNNDDIIGIINGTGSSENYIPNNYKNSEEIGNSNLSNMQESNLSRYSRIYERDCFNKIIKRRNAKIIELEEENNQLKNTFLEFFKKYEKQLSFMEEEDKDRIEKLAEKNNNNQNYKRREMIIIEKSKLPESSEEENGNSNQLNNKFLFTIENNFFPSEESLKNMQNKPDKNGLFGINPIRNNNNDCIIDNNNNILGNNIVNNNNNGFLEKLKRYFNMI